MKHSQSEAIPTSELYIICEYASEWKEKRDLLKGRHGGVWRMSV